MYKTMSSRLAIIAIIVLAAVLAQVVGGAAPVIGIATAAYLLVSSTQEGGVDMDLADFD